MKGEGGKAEKRGKLKNKCVRRKKDGRSVWRGMDRAERIEGGVGGGEK